MTDVPIAPDVGGPIAVLPMGKHWAQSMTIWGTLLTVASVVLPTLLPILSTVTGIHLTPEASRLFGEVLVQTAQALGGTAGPGLIVAGRIRAQGPLELRQIKVWV